MGEDEPKTCSFFKANNLTEPTIGALSAKSPLPWGGNVFGLADLSYLASLARPKLVGVIGPHNAGKTTLLATIYLLLHRGLDVERSRFSRSFTLGGWEAIASNLRFDGRNLPTFPAHTTLREARVPGLLHLGFRTSDGFLNDLVISDAPGEWFRRWAIDESASDVQGARWVAQKSDGFVLVLDSGALAGNNSGPTLNTYQQIIERLKKHAQSRPIHIVWTKSDVSIPEKISSRLKERLDAIFPNAPVTSVSVTLLNDDKILRSNYTSLVKWMQDLDGVTHSHKQRVRKTADPFLAYR